MTERDPVAVVVPFGGATDELAALVDSLGELDLSGGDEIILVDNTARGLSETLPSGIRTVRAEGQRSSYFARNVGAEVASTEWVLFLDADCRPRPDLLATYLRARPDAGCGILAGGVRGLPEQDGVVPAWARSRGHVSERFHVAAAPLPAGITANLLVRRVAWGQVGGFQEGIRSGGDLEFCWRCQEAGWTLEFRPEAEVDHVHVSSLRSLLAKARRYGGGQTWVDRRYPGWSPPARLRREIPRAMLGAGAFTVTGQLQRARFKLIDGAWYCALRWGRLAGDNHAPGSVSPDRTVPQWIATAFPKDDAPPASGAVEAVSRPDRPSVGLRREIGIRYAEDDPPLRRLGAALALALRHPWRCLGFAREHGLGALGQEAPAVMRLADGAVPPSSGPGAGARSRADRLARLGGW